AGVDATLTALAANVSRARTIVGTPPLLENVATLIDPPGSDRDESTWLGDVVGATGVSLLLDLHNLHANALNFGFDAVTVLKRLPLSQIEQAHLSGGQWIGPPGCRRLGASHRAHPP